MTAEQKQEFTRRITQANPTGLTIILYDITLTYLADAKSAWEKKDAADFCRQLNLAEKCVLELIANLNFLFDPARELHQIYLYMKKTMRDARIRNEADGLDDVIKNMTSLKEAYESIKDMDTSPAVMAHTQTVTAGLTYGKNAAYENLTDQSSNRGFCV